MRRGRKASCGFAGPVAWKNNPGISRCNTGFPQGRPFLMPPGRPPSCQLSSMALFVYPCSFPLYDNYNRWNASAVTATGGVCAPRRKTPGWPPPFPMRNDGGVANMSRSCCRHGNPCFGLLRLPTSLTSAVCIASEVRKTEPPYKEHCVRRLA